MEVSVGFFVGVVLGYLFFLCYFESIVFIFCFFLGKVGNVRIGIVNKVM